MILIITISAYKLNVSIYMHHNMYFVSQRWDSFHQLHFLIVTLFLILISGCADRVTLTILREAKLHCGMIWSIHSLGQLLEKKKGMVRDIHSWRPPFHALQAWHWACIFQFSRSYFNDFQSRLSIILKLQISRNCQHW